jgi:PAS domain S-box-containing protein
MVDGLVVVTPDWRIAYVNPAFERMVLFSGAELLGRPIDELTNDEGRATIRAARAARIAGRARSVEIPLRRRDGCVLDVLTASAPLSGTDGRVLVTVTDITQQKATEARLRELVLENQRVLTDLREASAQIRQQRDFLGSLFENLREEITVFDLVHDENGRVVDWVVREANAAAREAVGGEDFAGRRMTEAFGDERVRPLIDGTDRILAGEAPRREVFCEPAGRWYTSVSFALDANTIVSAAMDITARRNAEEMVKNELARNELLVAELTEAAQQVKTLSGFLPMCSHCRKVRDDDGYWNQLEAYISTHTDAMFSHGICPDCLKAFFPEAADDTDE